MYKNILLMRNGCEGCSMETCLGVLLAESLNAKVTAVYVTGNSTGQDLRKICGADELKWPGADRAGKEAMAAAESRKEDSAKEALEWTEKMCADRGIRCEKVRLSCNSAFRGVMKMAADNQCDVIVISTHSKGVKDLLFDAMEAKTIGHSKIPVLLHRA